MDEVMANRKDQRPPVLSAAQAQLAEELMMSINLALQEERVSLSTAQGAVDMVQMRLDALVQEGMETEVGREMGWDEEAEEEDPNEFLRRPRRDKDDDA